MSLSLLRQNCFNLSKIVARKDYLRISSHHVQLVSYSNNGKASPNITAKSEISEELKLKISAYKSWQTMSKREKMSILIKDYGKTIIIFHIIISLISLGVCYILISSGLDISNVINFLTFGKTEKFNAVMKNSSTFLIAYGVHKLLAPVRLSVTIACAPVMVRYFRRYGLIKPALLKQMENKK